MGGSRGRKVAEADKRCLLKLIAEAQTAGCRKKAACELLGIDVRTVQRWKKAEQLADGRKGPRTSPKNKLSEAERQKILTVVNQAEYAKLPPSQIVPRLADKGIYLGSESTFYRLLKAEHLLTHRGRAKPAKHKRPETLTATAPNQIWSWDITYLPTEVKGLFYYLYLIIDVYSRKIVGAQVFSEESSEHAATLVNAACQREGISRDQLILHSDNGSPMKGATLLAKLYELGVTPSYSRPSVSNDNPFSESMFRTLKYCPAYPRKPFGSLLLAQAWVDEFVPAYNGLHRHSGLKFITPQERHEGRAETILMKRDKLYQQAKAAHPERWTRRTRNWQINKVVYLHPPKEKIKQKLAA